MTTVRTLIFSVAFAAAFVPAVSTAAGEYHPAATEASVVHFPDHRVSNTSRAEVIAQKNDAINKGYVDQVQRGYPWPTAKTSVAKTRADVMQETYRAMAAGEIVKGE